VVGPGGRHGLVPGRHVVRRALAAEAGRVVIVEARAGATSRGGAAIPVGALIVRARVVGVGVMHRQRDVGRVRARESAAGPFPVAISHRLLPEAVAARRDRGTVERIANGGEGRECVCAQGRGVRGEERVAGSDKAAETATTLGAGNKGWGHSP
jgi:hypothetical protein